MVCQSHAKVLDLASQVDPTQSLVCMPALMYSRDHTVTVRVSMLAPQSLAIPGNRGVGLQGLGRLYAACDHEHHQPKLAAIGDCLSTACCLRCRIASA